MGLSTSVSRYKTLGTMAAVSVVLRLSLLLSFCVVSFAAGDEVPVHMTVVYRPLGDSRYTCYRSEPDRDAAVSYGRYVRTRTLDPQNRGPTSASPGSVQGSIRVNLYYQYQNYFGIYFCRARKRGRLLTTITATVLLYSAKIVPADGLYTKTVNAGDTGVLIEMSGIVSSTNDFAWRFNNSGILTTGSPNFAIEGAVTQTQAGVYECHYLRERDEARQGLVRLIVRGCPAGRWGPPECSGVCDNCYNGGICNDLNGQCVCPAGFRGENCLQACGAYRFGFSCEIQCSSTDNCRGLVFCVPDPMGCRCNAGYAGYDCLAACPSGTFGASCLQECHCDPGSRCDRFTGECSRGCAPGWSGQSCQIPGVCGSDFYGTDCTGKCQCLEDRPCDKQTGGCPNGQCKPGFTVYPGGFNCQECRDGTYGVNCAGVCHCEDSNCVKSSGVCNGGCKTNWAEPDCTTGIVSFINTKANSGQTSMFTCIVTGDPLPLAAAVKVYRSSNDGQYESDTSNVIGSERVLTFVIPAVELGEEFTCYIVEPYVTLLYTADMYELPVLTRQPRAMQIKAREVTIEWDAWSPDVGDTGDPPITAYTVQYRPQNGDSQEWLSGTMLPVTATSLTATVGELAPETAYELGVAVSREGVGGEGAIGAILSVTTLCSEPLKPPDDVQASSKQQIKRQIVVTWQDLQADFQGCSTGITQYRIRYTPDLDTGTSVTDTVDHVVTAVNLTGLEPYVQYAISIRAVNEIGDGPWSDVIMTYTPEEKPPPPQMVTIPRSTTSSITVQSEATSPHNLNGNVSHYFIQYSLATEGALTEATVMRVNQTGYKMTYTITGLPSTTDYTIRVKIVNGVGGSDWSEAVKATTVETGGTDSQTGNGGSVAGGILGTLFIIIIAIVVVLLVRRRRRQEYSGRQNSDKPGTIHKNNAYDSNISDNTDQGTAKDLTPADVSSAETHKTADNEATIYANAGLAPDQSQKRTSVTRGSKKGRFPAKPAHKPPPPSSIDPNSLPLGLLQLFAGIKQPTDSIISEQSERTSLVVVEAPKQSSEPEPAKQPSEPETTKQSSEPESTPKQSRRSRTDDECAYGNVNLGPKLSVAIPVAQLDDYITKKKDSSTDSLKYEFSLLPADQTKPWTVASNPDLKTRNRFKNIIPYDESRVQLEAIEGVKLSHYYNASYIQDYKHKNSFVAAMGPNAASLNDFWRMIWQEKFNIIVMATRLVESGKEKCKRYWPTTVNEEETFGKIVVKLLEVETFSDYAISTLQIHQAGQDDVCHNIKHFNITTWPDMGVPLYPTSVLNLVQVVKDARSPMLKRASVEAEKPILVHCSAGVGRTGTFIAIYTLMDMMLEQGEVSVFRFAKQMRENRVNMVQTYEQYAFIYAALLEGHLSGDTRMPLRYFIERFAKLRKINPKTRRRYVEEQYKALNQITPPPDKEAYGAATLPENADKNRFEDALPLERNRPNLAYAGIGTSSYINASFVDGFKRKEAFITTQLPLQNTMTDLWRLVYDWKCPTIVMMNGPHTFNNEPVQYWPDSGSLVFGSLCVEMIDQSKGRIYNSTTLGVSKSDNSEGNTLTVKHFQLNGWEGNEDKPNSPQIILDLLDAVNQWQSECQSTGPTLVQCINGVGRSGVFCAVSNVYERMGGDEIVDVFQAVKRLRMNRPQMIESLEQFILCYEVIHQHLERFQHYDNLL
ncbi:receptor-type tyrosine-protein phosphatase kappa-like [Patiria miniata]|uniref:protein-tyrosine-phosphatase n=1 Tax=Patiria miniata TaxID=46514 RepID=A0A914AYD9_PATMI|nr:receptor-type tyrosine-protein phosphatase kappa-like [Patiria miniata]